MLNKQQQWQFGLISKVILDNNPETWDLNAYLYDYEEVKSFFEYQPFEIVGEVDGRTTLVKKNNATEIYAIDEWDKIYIFPVATSLETLIAFLDEIAILWCDIPTETIIKDKALALEILDNFDKNNPHISSEFWEIHCFAGLNISFPLG